MPVNLRECRFQFILAASAEGCDDDPRRAWRTGILAPDGDVWIGTERDADPIQEQHRRRPQHFGQIDSDAIVVGHCVHQRTCDVEQAAAPQRPVGQFEDIQAHCIDAGRLVIADKALALQCPQDVVRGAAMQTCVARDLARTRRTPGYVQYPKNGRCRDNGTHGLSKRTDLRDPSRPSERGRSRPVLLGRIH